MTPNTPEGVIEQATPVEQAVTPAEEVVIESRSPVVGGE
jgi:hypothetical protein